MKLVIILNILLLALYSTCVKSEQDSDFILESSLITASAKFTTNIFENSIDINQFGTFLLHLPSSITYEYATYTNEEETMFSTPTQNNANLTTLKTSTALQTNKSTATVTNPYRTRITLSDISKQNYSTYSTSMSSNFKTKTSFGSGNHGAVVIPTDTLFFILSLIFFLF
ncbi:uncharacterized protein PWA37_001290 [Arxiozyma heterogenica]|uniref:uncharacterized protein n=1 Tax=Arxiozyma heterogenica TaxID=278026 RepID=UPI002EEA68CE